MRPDTGGRCRCNIFDGASRVMMSCDCGNGDSGGTEYTNLVYANRDKM